MDTPKTNGFSTGAGPINVISMEDHLNYIRDGINERKAMQKQINSHELELLEIKKNIKRIFDF